VHRLQLDGGDAERPEVVDGHGVRQAGVGAPKRLGDVGVRGREPLDVHLVDDRLVQRHVGCAVGAPVEVGADDHDLRHVRRAVGVVAAIGVAEVVGEAGRVPVDAAVDGLGIGVEQQLVGIASLALGGIPRAVDPEAVALPDADARQVAVPAEPVDLGQRDAGLTAVGVEQAELDGVGGLGVQGEVRARAVVGGPQRVGPTRPDLDVVGHRTVSGLRSGS
jgi:hypothetical protein